MANPLEFTAKLEAFGSKEAWTAYGLSPKRSIALRGKSRGAKEYLLDD